MSFTNQTPNYGLPQWIAADKPKFLTDINNAYSTIDTQIKNANDTANTADGNATSALSIAGQAATTAEGAATVAGQAAALAQSVNELVGTLNAKMGSTSIATVGDGTVTGAIDAIYIDFSKNEMGNSVYLDSYNTQANQYVCPSDGYIRLDLNNAQNLKGTVYINDNFFMSCNDSMNMYLMLPIYVKKGAKVYVDQLTGRVIFTPLE